MKFTTVATLLAVAVASVSAEAHYETNANRMARGLPPNPPIRRGSPTEFARRGRPSNTSEGKCNVGKVQCCNSVTHASSGTASILTKLLGIVVPGNTAVGIACSPLSVLGIGGNHCNASPVCCENNNFNGIIAIGCSPININA